MTTMEALRTDFFKSRGRPSPHNIKQWQLHGTDFEPAMTESLLLASETRMSSWTPVVNKQSNDQLFLERTTLILHWFDLWTDRQRKEFILKILARCTRSQLKFTRDRFMETVPVTHADFTAVLPRFLSLYILSFLNPLELCTAAQVCWHWRFLAEQDCLWAPKCVKRGWFLPYTPSEQEYGVWKRHYMACAFSLDYMTPREAADVYGTLNEPLYDSEEQEERKKERWIRQCIREKVAEHKRATLMSRRAWLSSSWSGAMPSINARRDKLWTSVSQQGMTAALVKFGERSRSQLSLSRLLEQEERFSSPQEHVMKKNRVACSLRSLPKWSAQPLDVPYQQNPALCQPPRHLLLVSSRVPAHEMALSGVQVGVMPLLYDHSGATLEALLTRVEMMLQGRMVRSVGVLAEGDTEEVHLLRSCKLTQNSVLRPDVREFWEKLAGWVVPQAQGGSLFIFCPLAASETGMELISKMSTLTGLRVTAPSGLATGSYQHVLGDWSGGEQFPPSLYFCDTQLVSWARQAEWLEEGLGALRKQLWPQLRRLSQEAWGRVLGQFLWDTTGFSESHIGPEVSQALSEGLALLSRETCENPLEFLSSFLHRRCERSLHGNSDGRARVARELLRSEEMYVQLLQAVAQVYHDPLKAALDSNRAILSSCNVLMIFSPVLEILEVNRVFLVELTERLAAWGPVQCVGDVFLKLCSKLMAYTNFFNNYPALLRAIDRCREVTPAFRAFLKRHDRTLATSMLSLQELLLLPSSRIEEYRTLLQALFLHTTPEHPDCPHLSSALRTLGRYAHFLCELKESTDGDSKILETQKMIQGCPRLREGNRHLIMSQEVVLLSSAHNDIAESLRVYEQVGDLGLFLFNDALVFTRSSVSHLPFRHARSTSHAFLASVALRGLILGDIADSKYVKNAFVLESATRRWVCATEEREDKVTWLSGLRRAIAAAIGEI